MCGIAGILPRNNSQYTIEEYVQLTNEMIISLKHRGPDDDGMWHDSHGSIFLGHARLSILDTTSAGQQPMTSPNGQYVITYNGELYNYLSLKDTLQSLGTEFRTNSDTEVLLACFEQFGLKDTLTMANGMFALALWDKKDKQLYLARDRVGIKPLYFSQINNAILFASDTRAFKEHPEFDCSLSSNAITMYFQKGYIPPELSIYSNAIPITPGSIVRFDNVGLKEQIEFWSFSDIVINGLSNPLNHIELAELHHLLRDSIKLRMQSDVPYGAFLSGGIDSSLIVAQMNEISDVPVQTFSIGFDIENFNEAGYARRIAENLNTKHTEYIFTKSEALDSLFSVIKAFDEPFADSSQLPTLLVSQLASEKVKVILSGDGGDELFGGYNRYFSYLDNWKQISNYSSIYRYFRYYLFNIIGLVSDYLKQIFPYSSDFHYKLQKYKDASLYFSNGMLTTKFSHFYYNKANHIAPLSDLLSSNVTAETIEYLSRALLSGPSNIKANMLFQDFINYLPGDILTKVDRASMYNSLEVRVPFLDHRIVELACRFPIDDRVCPQRRKWPLKSILECYIPAPLFDRPKKGFSVPIGEWLRTDLKEWAENMIYDRISLYSDYLQPNTVHSLWTDHKLGRFNRKSVLWNILMFISWLD